MNHELHRVEWRHPRHGLISETVCLQHERQVLSALRTLGIGSGGSVERTRRSCYRCLRTGERVATWVASFATTEPTLP